MISSGKAPCHDLFFPSTSPWSSGKHLRMSSSQALAHWYVSNVSIIFDDPCLFLHHLLSILLHFVVFLCIFRN
jgi:hypothetical protein